MPLTFQDKLEIQELASRYAVAMDTADPDAWLDTWDESGSWEGGLGVYTGKNNLKRLLPDLGDRIKGKRHVMVNFIIDGNGDEAKQTCYMLVIEAVNAPCILATAMYKDTLKRVNGQWKFVHRSLTLDRVPVSTNSQ